MHARAEERHTPSGESTWEESFALDFWSVDANLGGGVRIGLLPNLGVSWIWASLVGADRPLLTVLEHEAPLPRRDAIEVRTSGLWCDYECLQPFTHVSIGLEAFGLEIEDPDDVFGDLRGHRRPLGFDLEWDTDGSRRDTPEGPGYEMPCRVDGEILQADQQIDFRGFGWRRHEWGPARWWDPPWTRVALRLADGTYSAARDHLDESLEVVARAPVRVEVEGRAARVERNLVRVAGGAGWVESCRPEEHGAPGSSS